MAPPKLHLTYPPNIAKVGVHTKRFNFLGRGLWHVPFLVAYLFALRACFETSGDPYRTALAHHQGRGYDPAVFATAGSGAPASLNSGKPKVVDDWGGAASNEEDTWGDLEADDDASTDSTATATLTTTKDSADADAAHEEITYETPPTLPSSWLPEFWAVAWFSGLATAHVLTMFAQHWSIKFRAFVNYKRCETVDAKKFLMFVPQAHQGKAEIVSMRTLEIADATVPSGVRTMLWTVFQRQRFEFVVTETDANGVAIKAEVREVATPVSMPLREYAKPSRGLSPSQVESATSRYGDNSLKVPLPTFWTAYKEQLMGPVTVFQIFTTLLWLLDEYWKYALFSAMSLMMFEATTAFSKIKNIRTLRGMGQAATQVAVLREGRWEQRSSEQLVPGDVVSIARPPGGGDMPIPCDCLVLRGSAVVNEASLTGESVPQMKDSLSVEAVASDPNKPLDIAGDHKVNVLFSGTTLMQQSPGDSDSGASASLPKTPDDGCLCVVLQTGFSSTQGKLMRMMEFSSEQVTGDTYETLILLFILLVFALLASGNVFINGMKDGKRSQYELVLRCVLILTSVVPPELPMQTAMAVNTALIALMRASVFCTEPFRVPIAGKVDTCLFDKTGTLTSDKLVATGVVTPLGTAGKGYSQLTKCPAAPKNASLVIAGCHSLVQIDGKTFGDPLEQAALMGVKWRFNPKTQTSLPTEDFKDLVRDKALLDAETKRAQFIASLPAGKPHPPPVPKPVAPTRTWQGKPSVKILQRNHFSSVLQRMSTVAVVTKTTGATPEHWVCMKGSPEMVATLLQEKPSGYDGAYRALAEEGARVIALAHRPLTETESLRIKDSKNPLTRDEMERGLVFDGFLAFACAIRVDTPDVVKALLASSHTVMMATGDATLTGLHVANEVGIARGGLEGALMLVLSHDGTVGRADQSDTTAADTKSADTTNSPVNPKLKWVSAKTDLGTEAPMLEIPYVCDGKSIVNLSKQYSLCVTGETLNAALAEDRDGGLWDFLDSVVIFARMSPDDKERVLKRLKQQGRHTFMCGDGANDVGALKQAHVGVALLSGFGGANTKPVPGTADSGGSTTPVTTTNPDGTVVTTKAETFAEKMKRVQDAQRKMKEDKATESSARKRDQAELLVLQKKWFEEEAAAREAAGDKWAQFGAMKAATTRMVTETKRRAAERQRARGGAMQTPGFAQMMQEMEGAEDMETSQVKLGDASMAAPFTSRIPSVRSAVDIIRQGRCTLVSAIQMQQVLVLSCLISAYSLSVLYLDGIRSSDNQMIASGSALTAASLAFSYATPVHTLSPVRPLRSIFHPANFISLIGQLVIHIGCMVFAVRMVKLATGEEANFPENVPIAKVPDSLLRNATDEQRSIWSQGPPFTPSLLNTVVFLVETVQRVCVMLVNYKGRPHMMGAIENKTLLLSLASMVCGAFACAFEVSPWLNNWLQLVPLPDDHFRVKILLVLLTSVLGTIVWDQLMLLIFAPRILFTAYQDTLRALPRPKDLGKPAAKFFFALTTAYLYFLNPATKDNGFVLVGAFYMSKVLLK